MKMSLLTSKTIHKYFDSYKKWITSNPQLVGDIETTIKWLSYFTAGRINNSAVMSELVYSMSNLLVFFNDRLICKNTELDLKLPKYQSKIKVWLTILEYLEVLLEITAHKLWGETGKWFIVIVLQAFKSLMRLVLVHCYKERIIQTPNIPPVKRESIIESVESGEKEGFTLKRSNKVIRRVDAVGPSQFRTWVPLPPLGNNERQLCNTLSPRKYMILAETLYALKPLLHLGCISISGKMHWKPWFLAFIIDLASINLYSREMQCVALKKEELQEISRRRIGLLLYIIRSPFYDKYSKTKIHMLLKMLSNNVPLARIIAEPIIKYLPHWQSTYFYMWSTVHGVTLISYGLTGSARYTFCTST